MSRSEFVNSLTDIAQENLLIDIMEKLDDLSQDDFMGTEGWVHTLGLEGRVPNG